MYEGYLSLGCNEILNASRAFHYARTADCPISWLQMTYCDNLADALNGGVDYDAVDIAQAPWYDERDPATARFYGAYPVSISGFTDSTRTATVTEGILDGGTVSGYRHAVRQIRVRAILIARGQDALEAGFSWLDAALAPDTCSTHGDGCGEVDLQFFASCPPRQGDGESNEDYQERVDAVTRVLHGVTTISGPTVEEKLRRDAPDGGVWAYIVEFILAAGTPWVFSLPKQLVANPSTPETIQDIPYNLAPYPSAELVTGTATVLTNYSTNPSVETATTGWAVALDGSVITSGASALSQSTELKAAGSNSAKITWTAPNTAAGGWVGMQQEVTLPADAGQRYSINLWATVNVESGTAVLGGLDVIAYWRAGGATLRADTIGTIAGLSGAVSRANIDPPAGATSVIVRCRGLLTSWSTGAKVRLYADALAVTVP